MSGTRILEGHPFKDGVRRILRDHFGPQIANKFSLNFEAESFSKDSSIHIYRQVRDNNLVLEVRYQLPDGTSEFICDLYSWWDRPHTEYALLRFITDKVKSGKIGKDWVVTDNRTVSDDVTSGKYETPDEPSTGDKDAA